MSQHFGTRPERKLAGMDAFGAKLSDSQHAGKAPSLLRSQFNQRLHRVPGLEQFQTNTPPVCISAVWLRTSSRETWRHRSLQLSALQSTTCEVNLGFRSLHIIAATSVRSSAWPTSDKRLTKDGLPLRHMFFSVELPRK
jgi:hypothetical protein